MDARKCKWEHPRCKALDCNGRCVALTDTSFPRRTDCPFYDNNAKFKATAEQQAEKKRKRAKIRDGLIELKYRIKGTKACKECACHETCTMLSYGCLLINLALNELKANK